MARLAKFFIVLMIAIICIPFINSALVTDATGVTMATTQTLTYPYGWLVRPNYNITIYNITTVNDSNAINVTIFKCPHYINGSVYSQCNYTGAASISESTGIAEFNGSITLVAGGYYQIIAGKGSGASYTAYKTSTNCAYPFNKTNLNVTAGAINNAFAGNEGLIYAVYPCFNIVSVQSEVQSTPAANNTCSYTSGNWVINVADNCNITTAINLGRANVTINGSRLVTDRLYITGSIKNFTQVNWIGVNTTIWGNLG